LGLGLRIQDYERLEFLGDSILSYLVAKYFFLATQDDETRKMPKELHKMKTSIIQNCCLSLIVIEQGIHKHIIYNEKATAFKEQFDKCVDIVKELNMQFGTTKQLSELMEKRAHREKFEETKDHEMEG
jgi:dsRNA-specific ribonuclease